MKEDIVSLLLGLCQLGCFLLGELGPIALNVLKRGERIRAVCVEKQQEERELGKGVSRLWKT